MAYEIRSEKGLPIKKQGSPVLATDTLEVKISDLDDKAKSFIAIASTEHEDRDKDIIRQEGWNLTNFRKNPVVPWSHNYYAVPVARSLKTWIDEDNTKGPRLLFQPKFDEDDDDSMKIYNKYKNGFLTSFSVGFRGIDYKFRNEEAAWWGGREFTKQELLEISTVAVPSNPHANTRLSYMGDSSPENMIQMGYPEIFAKTKTGLFYPVMDVTIFSQPKEFEVDKGVVGIKAVPLDNVIKVNDPVAYLFDPDMFDDKSANEWIAKNVEKKCEIKYFDLHNGEENNFILESITAEDDIKHFEKSVDLCNQDTSDKELDKKDQIDDSIVKDDEADTIAISVKRIIEIVTTIKDFDGNVSNGKVIDTEVEIIASNKEFESIYEFKEWKANKVISLLKCEIDNLKNVIEDLSKKKTVANLSNTIDNNDNLDQSGNDSQQKISTNEDDFIELDNSLITNPDDNEKTNQEDLIEIDNSLLEESKSDTTKTVTEVLIEKLKTNLKEVLSNVSGKID